MKYFRSLAISLLGLLTVLAGCKEPEPDPAEAMIVRQQEVTRFNEFLASTWEARLAASPELRSRLGQRIDYDRWDDISDAADEGRQRELRRQFVELATFDYTALSADFRLSYELFEEEANRRIERYRWRQHHYLLRQETGIHAAIPAFLISVHEVRDEADALAYIARLRAIQPLFQQAEQRLGKSEALGVIPPRFVFADVANEIRALVRGRPFERTHDDSVLLKDFRSKLASLDIPEPRKRELTEAASAALLEAVKPAYDSLAAKWRTLARNATTDDGAWKLPNGAQYYRGEVRWYTTSDLTPDELHATGLAEVARIHEELEALMPALGFKGTLPELFAYMSRVDSLSPPLGADRTPVLPGLDVARLPEFRQHFPASAFTEGWTLYVERLAKDRGEYADSRSEYGRLERELVQAARLVVDTGIHAKRWTREQAMKFLKDNTPMLPPAVTEAVDRCIVSPGEATAPMAGFMRLLQLREQAMAALGTNFDEQEFRQVLLRNGPVSLTALQRLVNRYIDMHKEQR